MKDVLIIKSNAILRPAHLENYRKTIMEQIKSGVVIIPAELKAELINVPDNIEVIVEETK